MNRKQLARFVAERVGLTHEQAEAALIAMIDGIKSEIVSGGTVSLVGFGKFYARMRRARVSRHPRIAGEFVQVPPKGSPVFRFSKSLKDYVSLCLSQRP